MPLSIPTVGADRFPAIPSPSTSLTYPRYNVRWTLLAISFDRAALDGHVPSLPGSLVLFAAISVVTGALDEVLRQALENGRSGDILTGSPTRQA